MIVLFEKYWIFWLWMCHFEAIIFLECLASGIRLNSVSITVMFLISLLALVYKAEGYLNFEVASIKRDYCFL